jgi:hypothetical protein
MKRLSVFIVIVLVIFAGYLYFSKPGDVIIDETGKADGLMNRARAAIQGEKFWRYQLKLASEQYYSSLQPYTPSSTELIALYQKMREDLRALDEKMKTLYTPEELIANSFRVKADSIERAAKWRVLDADEEKTRIIETEKIKKIVEAIEAKLNIDKSQSVLK